MSQGQDSTHTGGDRPAGPDQEAPLARASTVLGDAVARLSGGSTAADGPDEREKKGAATALGSVVSALAASAKAGGKGAVVGGTFLADLLSTTATRLPLRDKETLIAQHPGLETEQLADSLEQSAARISGTIGATAGGLAAAQWLVTPSLLAVPVELAAETLLVAAVELKLVAELHEIYDARPAGDLSQRASAYLESWTAQRGLRGDRRSAGLAGRLAAAGNAALRKRITTRLARNLGSFLPFLAGAVIGARYNSSGTRKLSRRLRADLAVHPERIPSQRLGPA